MAESTIPHISILLEDGFNSEKAFGILSKMLFDLDDESRKILRIIAEEGLITEYQIAKKGLTRMLTREIVRRRLVGVENTSKCLVENGFVIQKRGKRHRNTGKITKPYALTLKGMIACLGQVPFEEIFMVKKYQEMILKWTKNNEKLSNAVSQIIKYDIGLFMVSNVIASSDFTGYKRIGLNFYMFNDNDPLLDPYYPQPKIRDKRLQDISLKIRYRFFVSQMLFQTILRQITKKPMKKILIGKGLADLRRPKGLEFVDDTLPQYVRYWYDHIDRVQFEDFDTFDPNVMPWDDEKPEGIDISLDSLESRIVEILEKLEIKEPNYFELPLIWR